MPNNNNILKYADYPTDQEWDIIANKYPSLSELRFDSYAVSKRIDNLGSIYSDLEFPEWLRLLNNRLGTLNWSFIIATHYFNKGIPDERWYQSPGPKGEPRRYWPNFEIRHFCIKWLYDFYAEVFYSRAFTAIDSLYQLINIYYQLYLEPSLSLNRMVEAKIEALNPGLHNYLGAMKENAVIKGAREIRNSFIRNYPPSDIGGSITKSMAKGEVQEVLGGSGRYTPSKEIQDNMSGLLKVLAEALKKIGELIYGSYSQQSGA